MGRNATWRASGVPTSVLRVYAPSLLRVRTTRCSVTVPVPNIHSLRANVLPLHSTSSGAAICDLSQIMFQLRLSRRLGRPALLPIDTTLSCARATVRWLDNDSISHSSIRNTVCRNRTLARRIRLCSQLSREPNTDRRPTTMIRPRYISSRLGTRTTKLGSADMRLHMIRR